MFRREPTIVRPLDVMSRDVVPGPIAFRLQVSHSTQHPRPIPGPLVLVSHSYGRSVLQRPRRRDRKQRGPAHADTPSTIRRARFAASARWSQALATRPLAIVLGPLPISAIDSGTDPP